MNAENYKDIFDEIKNINLHYENAYEYAIWKILTLVELPMFAFTLPKNTIIYRSRTHEDNVDFYNNITDIGTTPNKFITNFGRCNRPGQSMFYASENRPISYVELLESWSKNKRNYDSLYVTIGAWELKKDLDFLIINSPDKYQRISDYDIIHGEYFDEIIKDLDKDKKIYFNKILNFLCNIFRESNTDTNNNHILTSAFSNVLLMHPKSGLNGISYPSVPSENQGINFAIMESFAKEHLELKSALRNKFSISIVDKTKCDFKEVGSIKAKKIDLKNNKIIW